MLRFTYLDVLYTIVNLLNLTQYIKYNVVHSSRYTGNDIYTHEDFSLYLLSPLLPYSGQEIGGNCKELGLPCSLNVYLEKMKIN